MPVTAQSGAGWIRVSVKILSRCALQPRPCGPSSSECADLRERRTGHRPVATGKKPHLIPLPHAFLGGMKKSNGQIPRRRRVMNYAAAAFEQIELYCAVHPGSPSAVRRPRLLFRSELWIAVLGPSIEEGIVGIGPTVAAALRAFDAQYLAGLRPASGTIGTASALPVNAVTPRRHRNPRSTAKSRAEISGPPGLSDGELPSDFGTTDTAL